MYDIVILTDERFVNPIKKTEYITNLMTEDRLVIDALEKQGLKTKKVAWSDPEFDWSQTRFALFRTTWDYQEKFIKFKQWLTSVTTKTILINDHETILWNLDKHYLNDLKEKGINIVDTYFIEPGDSRPLKELQKELGWEQLVLKPAISASAKDTFKLSSENIDAHESRYNELIKNESMILQPFLYDIAKRGELSLMVIGGNYTHSVLKVAKKGDFRVQDSFGGTVKVHTPTQEEINLAIATVNTCKKTPVYARVDIVNDNNGNPAVSELELIEPEMWFRKNKHAAEMLANELKKYV